MKKKNPDMKISNDRQNAICLGIILAIIIGMLVAVPDLPQQLMDLYHTVLGPPVPRMQ